MGGFISKEWSEVMTSASPGSPEEKKEEKQFAMADGAVARRRILNADPRSITDEVSRTPIQVSKTPNDSNSTPKAPPPAFIDPRSPSTELPRTPIVLTNPALQNPLTFEEDSPVKEINAKKPNRGAIAADLKIIEAKLESIAVEEDEKEEGEITHDTSSIEEENNENLNIVAPKTPPVTKRTKSSLENDCRSPLLIENDDDNPSVFDKLLSNELARVAAKNSSRKVLGERSNMAELDNSNNDSLVI